MATLVQTPDALSLSYNLKEVIISTSVEVRFRLKKGSAVLLDENYLPDSSGLVTIDIREIVSSSLSLSIPTTDTYEQTESAASFSIFIDSAVSAAATFTAVLGGVSGGASASTCLPANFLTWQPQEKNVTPDQPEWLTYYYVGAYVMKAKFYNKDGTDKTVTLMTGTAGKVYSVNCQFARLWPLGATTVGGVEKPRFGFIDVWVENSGTRLTYVQRYCYRRPESLDEIYVCFNSIGGIDTFLFTGKKKLVAELEHTVGSFDEKLKASLTDAKRRYGQNTGILKKENSGNLWDFFRSLHAYYLKDGTVTPIVLDSSTVEYSGVETANSWYFEYRLSNDDGLLNVQRSVNFPAVIEIPGPDQGTYYLAPRVVDYPAATIDSSLLLLLQSPFSQSWMRASLGDLLTLFNPVRSLTQLSDVLLTNPTTGQVLKYDGTRWINAEDGGGGGASIHSQLLGRDAVDSHPMGAITGLQTFKDLFDSLFQKEAVGQSYRIKAKLDLYTNDSLAAKTIYLPHGGVLDRVYDLGVDTNAVTAEVPSDTPGGASNLYDLGDVPDYRTSYRGKLLRSKADGSGMEWVDVPTSAVWGNITGTLANQTDLDNALAGKQPLIDASNKLAYSLISGTPSSLPASDVYPWAKAAAKPSYTLDEVGDGTSRKLSDYISISDAASTYHPKEGTPSLSMTASALILRAVDNYYANLIIADASGSAGYLSIQAKQEGIGWRNTILNPSGGNVGIGTTSPSQKLTVNGGVCMTTLYLPNNGAMSTTYSLTVNTNAITAEIPS